MGNKCVLSYTCCVLVSDVHPFASQSAGFSGKLHFKYPIFTQSIITRVKDEM